MASIRSPTPGWNRPYFQYHGESQPSGVYGAGSSEKIQTANSRPTAVSYTHLTLPTSDLV